jgi:hypothetical protein
MDSTRKNLYGGNQTKGVFSLIHYVSFTFFVQFQLERFWLFLEFRNHVL